MEHNLQNIINHTKFQEKLQLIAKEQKIAFSEVQKKGADCLAELYSQQHPGVISVIGQAFPKEFSTLINLGLQGNNKEAYEIHFKLHIV